jgi:hypothetical protein
MIVVVSGSCALSVVELLELIDMALVVESLNHGIAMKMERRSKSS